MSRPRLSLSGRQHRLEFLGLLGTTKVWTAWTNVTLSGPTAILADTNSTALLRRFHRAVLVTLP